nr:protein kinase [Deltaproteobacteria bacterium]
VGSRREFEWSMTNGSATNDRSAQRVGDFVLRRWLAQGGMAELYLATPSAPAQSTQVVVLKRVLPALSSSDNFVRMFAREAKLASMLRHPNIVAVDGTGDLQADDCFFTMEYVHGVDLGVLLDAVRQRGGALPLAHALTIVVAMCAGLHYAHEAVAPDGRALGVVHRDVSPSNVLLGFDGAIKVTDFGVAKALAMTRLTQEGTRKGKLSYMSPEQARGETVDRRADVFAIATVLYELTTLERLFGGDNDLAVMYNILHRERPSPRETNPGYPAALEAIVLKAVAPDLDDRYPSAAALQADLEVFAAEVGLELSASALAGFVAATVKVRPHPRDEPDFFATTTELRVGLQRQATVVDGARSSGVTAGTSAVPPTGPEPIVPGPVIATPSGATMAASSMPGAGISYSGAPGSATSWAGPPPRGPAAPSSRLQAWSVALAVTALLVAIGVGVMVWNLGTQDAGSTTVPAASPDSTDPPVRSVPQPATAPLEVPATAAPVTPPAAAVVPAVDPAAAVPSTPSEAAAPPSTRKSSSSHKRKKKRAARPTPSTPAPKPETKPEPETKPPKSTKPSPTDTLLPILE